jgi:hypothetical protein
MCRTYNTIGSLTALKSHLDNSHIHDFKSLKEVMNFQNSFEVIRKELISLHENLIEQEKTILNIDLQQLETEIQTQKHQSEQRLIGQIDRLKEQLITSLNTVPTNFLKKVIKILKQRSFKREIKQKEQNFDIDLEMEISALVGTYQSKKIGISL